MQAKSEIDMERVRIAKVVRSAVRLKHALAADKELNEVLPAIMAKFDKAVSAGQPFALNVGGVFDEG